MAVKLKNISEKIIGVGDVIILPEETREIPAVFERSPILEIYKEMGLVTMSGKPTSEVVVTEMAEAEGMSDADKKTKLDSLKDASDEDVASLAKELGINPADCKDLADVRKKVKAALSK
ncbi:hypothetical protein [Lachnoanaerobaculum saburreum]|uniref:Uncharacterized protein n=1 Tax=Lachnoanaerobaculum saburreum TaxID=467210 RepID=A0A133ZRX1_9FIRM|nr:hypothetical protein [Lachnoanaerobaculum saburreum]KXB58170.1 hypothetical protein HMPREF1866_01209 [Lachnoanaerobaculum saburreum]